VNAPGRSQMGKWQHWRQDRWQLYNLRHSPRKAVVPWRLAVWIHMRCQDIQRSRINRHFEVAHYLLRL